MFDPNLDFWGDDEHADIDYGVFPRARMHKKSWDQRLAALKLGRHICFGKGGGGSAPSPDPQIGQAALQEAQQGQAWLDFANKQFDIANDRQAATDALTNQVTTQQLGTAQQQQQEALQDRQRYQNVFEPLQDQYAAEAQKYNSADFQNAQADQAGAAARTAAAGTTAANTRSMAAMGINPNSGKFQGITRAQDTSDALNAASAENNARTTAQQTGLGLTANAVNMGNGLPASSSTATGLGLNAGTSAVGNNQSANSNWMANNGIMAQGFGGAMQGFAGQGSLLNSQYGNQIAGFGAQQQASAASSSGLFGGLGSLVGAGIGMY